MSAPLASPNLMDANPLLRFFTTKKPVQPASEGGELIRCEGMLEGDS